MRIFTKKILEMWRAIAFGLVLALLIGLLLFWHIGRNPDGLSYQEVQTVKTSQSIHSIANSPTNAPLTVPEHFLLDLSPKSLTANRTISAVYATLAIIFFFLVLRFWQDTKTALLGTALFGTSSWLLHVARLDTPGVLLLGVIPALALGLWFRHTMRRNFALFICALGFSSLMYVPGMIWFVLIGVGMMYKDIWHELERTSILARITSAIFFFGLITPLFIAIFKHPDIILTLLGLPQHFANITVIGKNFLHVPMWLFWRGPASDPTRWLGTTPVLNIFEIVMLILGIYSFWKHRQLGRSKAVLGGIIVSWLLISLGGPITLSILLPFLYIAIAGGVLYMFENWYSVFPANPLARATGTIFLAAVCILSCNYHLQNYFVAWQHSPATKSAFSNKS